MVRVKKRLDVLLVERGLAETRSQAQALVLAGRVRASTKAGALLDEAAGRARRSRRASSPGAARSSPTRSTRSGSTSQARTASTWARRPAGSRTACSRRARRGSARSTSAAASSTSGCARPAGHGVDRLNARRLSARRLPFAPTFVTCDVSFISAREARPAAGPRVRRARAGGHSSLVKPQFEAGRADVGRAESCGSRRAPARARRACAGARPSWGAEVVGECDSGLPGPKGNREFFLLLRDEELESAPLPSAVRARRRGDARRARDDRRRARAPSAASPTARAWSSSPTRTVADPTSPSRSAATARCCARCTASSARRARDRRQLRPGRLPDEHLARTSSRPASRARSPATTGWSSSRRSQAELGGERHAARQRRRRRRARCPAGWSSSAARSAARASA